MKTYSIKADEIHKDWFVADAENKALGRLASKVAQILKGKHKPTYTPHMDMGDFVVVVNAEKIRVSGNKEMQKTYFSHSGYPGGTKEVDLYTMRRRHPERVIQNAVKGMLPHNRLGRQMMRNLKIYSGPDHPHSSQQPKVMEF
ncbi:MAG: 50S ribosomal protein L13 [Candidatus Marinimicrobia bacterium]|nr:50S ribosomal protein L13 [Candidatus Neomarinimicrobiota bacterium]MDP6297155.1 50S ribosomal protein L13 [Candidatus Neomarinimicrobiota bacterium]MDP7483520.1 50S ribosomal protein L13 [Candidatus Neomarinimicrobiota bacterium]MDP7528091.1 50S ribosomal protein L13 [Candidatus Neomarinimicrobiota bacterium]MDP7716055.1 50S ribosomal protein L13 [Candidatus Neomarinimicrobiota bacterium]